MLVTLSGIVMLVRFLHLENAPTAIPMVLLLNVTEVTELSESITHLSTYDTPFSFCIRLEQPSNAEEPILVTLSGIVMLVRLEQYRNAEEPMLVTLSGIVMLVRLEQFSNAEEPILVILSGIVMLVILEQLLKAPYSIFPPIIVIDLREDGI